MAAKFVESDCKRLAPIRLRERAGIRIFCRSAASLVSIALLAGCSGTTPSLTIKSGISAPYSVAVDSAGTVSVANATGRTTTEYPAGSTTPSVTISAPPQDQIVGVAVDAASNV